MLQSGFFTSICLDVLEKAELSLEIRSQIIAKNQIGIRNQQII